MYRLIVHKGVLLDVRSFPAHDLERIMEGVRSLAFEPRPSGVKKLRGYLTRYRIRSGRYRIIYEIHDREKAVMVLVVGQRKDVYR